MLLAQAGGSSMRAARATPSETMATSAVESQRRWTASELRRLPAKERDAILEAAAELAAEDYNNDAALTAFEAFGPGDLHVHLTGQS